MLITQRDLQVWLAEICSKHPHLTKRLENIGLRSDDYAANEQGVRDYNVRKTPRYKLQVRMQRRYSTKRCF